MPVARPNGAAAALEKVRLEAADRLRRHKCFTCKEPRWVAFIKEGLELRAPVSDIYRALCNPSKYGLDFPAYDKSISTVRNHIDRHQ